MPPLLSVVIPAYNRADLLRLCLASVRRAGHGLDYEIVLVDDGSPTPLAEQLADVRDLPLRIVRQANTGLIGAKNHGLAEARGKFIQFLDSDDLVAPEKFAVQLRALEKACADVAYCDQGCIDLATVGAGPEMPPVFNAQTLPATDDSTRFYLEIQPAPHTPLFRTDYLRTQLRAPLVPPSPIFNPVGEVWIYFNLCTQPARIVRTPGVFALSGVHAQERITHHWEKQAVAAAALMHLFQCACPLTPETLHARQLVGERAFLSWRALPRGFPRAITRATLASWQRAPHGSRRALGGPLFRALAAELGPVMAGRLLRPLQRPAYKKVRTLPSATLATACACAEEEVPGLFSHT
jgi:hypothetical protein